MPRVTTQRTGAGDPARTVELLWRHHRQPAARRGPKPKLGVDDVVDAAIALADADGLDALTMRALAQRLGLPAMSLYRVIPAKAELLDLAVDACFTAMPRRAWRTRQSWRTRVTRVAEDNRALYARHPWLTGVSTARPPLGPGQLAKYDHELGAFDGLPVDDVTRDAALSHLLGFVRWAALAAVAERDDAAWWSAAGPALAAVVDATAYPLASRVGLDAGDAQGAALDADRAWDFGLRRVLDGLTALEHSAEAGRSPRPGSVS